MKDITLSDRDTKKDDGLHVKIASTPLYPSLNCITNRT
jgi:hypothetical protein